MAHNDWLDFPDFDVATWASQTASISTGSDANWKKLIWAEGANAIQLPARAIDSRESGNPWAITQTPARPSDVVSMLMGGVQGIRLNAAGADEAWLSDVHLEMVDVYIDADAISLEGFDLQAMAKAGWTGHCARRIHALDAEAFRSHVELTNGLNVRVWLVQTGIKTDYTNALADGLLQLERFRRLLKEQKGSGVKAWQSMVWKCHVGPHVLEGVACLRALRLVWDKWLESHGFDKVAIWIDAVASNESAQCEFATDRLIPMTASTYASVIGGADSIETVAHDAESETAAVDGQRWARNIQHLMREESGLHRVFDPMGGSRVVEAWTGSLVEAAWAQYEHMKGNMP
jgi:hypothetical protein